MENKTIPVKNSIAAKLLKVTFSIYMIITLTVTAIHMIAEYKYMKKLVSEELAVIQKTFEPALANALWNLSHNQLESILKGMVQLPQVTGVKLESQNGETIGKNSITIIDIRKESEDQYHTGGLFQRRFALTHMRAGKQAEVGNITIYSCSDIVVERVRVGFVFIAVNAVIKTIALWIVFLFIGRVLLARPLFALTNAVRSIDLDNLEHQKVDIGISGRNELKILEQSFNEMTGKLLSARNRLHEAQEEILVNERLAVLGHFAGNISHELRNPLGVIENAVYFLRKKLGNSDEKTNRHLDAISDSAKVSVSIIGNLLNLSRMKRPKKAKTDLAELISEVLQGMTVPDPVEVIWNLPKKKTCARIDSGQIRIALKNIIKNAIQAMNGSGTLKVSILSSEKEQAGIVISDTGKGIPPETVKKIFDPLFTAKEQGTCFGLSITKMIVEKHGGCIRVESVPGKGTEFTMTLPGNKC